MTEYVCQKCGKKSYTSRTDASGEKCIYDGCDGTIISAEEQEAQQQAGEQLCLFSQQ